MTFRTTHPLSFFARTTAVAATWLFFVGSALAAKDYDPDNNRWNGLSYLKETANEAKVELDFIQDVNWGKLETDDVLVFVFPQQPLPLDDTSRFVSDGGSIVILDDFGASAEFLEKIGILRISGEAEHVTYYQKSKAFPEFVPQSEHFLFFNIAGSGSVILANHPGRYRVHPPARPLLVYDGGTGQDVFLAESHLGKGGVVAVADSSLIINEMLRKHGNKQLTANLLRYFCTSDPCAAKIVLPQAVHSGSYRSPITDADGIDAFFRKATMAVNSGMQRVSDYLGNESAVRFGTYAGILLIVLLLWRWSPGLLPLRQIGAETALPEIPAEATVNARGLLGAKELADFSQPAMTLKALMERVVFGTETPRYSTPSERNEMADQYLFLHPQATRAANDELRAALLQVFEFFHTLHVARGNVGATSGYVTAYSQFELIKTASQKILDVSRISEPDDWSRAFSRTTGTGRIDSSGRV
ncbi:MAG: hypothetical protein HUU55_21885 [Myxococcales bacterium]|nr:hypothetical protein [Myxococcales bacterium]